MVCRLIMDFGARSRALRKPLTESVSVAMRANYFSSASNMMFIRSMAWSLRCCEFFAQLDERKTGVMDASRIRVTEQKVVETDHA